MRRWRSIPRHCEACCSIATRRIAARRLASARSAVEVAREEQAENVRWSKQPEARGVLEQPLFGGLGGASAGEGALDSLDAYLQARQWHHPRGGPARRFLSHLLTYPLTLASGVREAGLGSLPAPTMPSGRKHGAASSTAAREESNACSESGLGSGASSSSGESDRRSDGSDRDGGGTLAVVCLGARAESTMPPSFWGETVFALPGVSHLSLHLVGPELSVPPGVAAGQGARPTAGGDGGRGRSASFSSTATHATALSVGGRTVEVRWTRAMLGRVAAAGEAELRAGDSSEPAAAATATATAAAEKAVVDADAFVLFNPGLGHPHLREGWAGALERLLDTGKPIVVSSHSEKDLERDALLLREVGAVRCCRPRRACPDQAIASGGGADGEILPRKNAFRSLMVSEDPLSAPGHEELVSCNWGIVVVRGTRDRRKCFGGKS